MENGDHRPEDGSRPAEHPGSDYGAMYYYGFTPERTLMHESRDGGMIPCKVPQGNRNSLLWPSYGFSDNIRISEGIRAEDIIGEDIRSGIGDGIRSEDIRNSMADTIRRFDMPTQSHCIPKSPIESSYGCLHTEIDCRRLIDRVRKGLVTTVKRRLNPREKTQIRPGSMFVYTEQESGIRRWTDKKEWSPSRVQGCFLVYRELQGQLLKKTYASVQAEGTYHIVVYSLMGWEEQGRCCEQFRMRRRVRRGAEIVEEKGRGLKVTETYLADVEMREIEFSKVNIKEKVVSGEEYDRKGDYERKGEYVNGKSRMSDNGKAKCVAVVKGEADKRRIIDDSSDILVDSGDNGACIDNGINGIDHTINNNTNINHTNTNMNYIKPKNPSSYENQQARLLFFSPEGYMISLESPVANKVIVKSHQDGLDTVEIKDPLRATLGSFHGRNFVLSDGKTINFSDAWQRPIPCSLLGIDDEFVYAFEGCHLRLIDFGGRTARTIYVPGAYTFCLGDGRLAVLCRQWIMLYGRAGEAADGHMASGAMADGHVASAAEYIPAGGADFGSYDEDRLYVRIGREIFEVVGGVLELVFETEERPLAVTEGHLVTLGEDVLLPRPSLRYHRLRK